MTHLDYIQKANTEDLVRFIIYLDDHGYLTNVIDYFKECANNRCPFLDRDYDGESYCDRYLEECPNDVAGRMNEIAYEQALKFLNTEMHEIISAYV